MPHEPSRFDPQSTDAMFARLLAEMEADRRARQEFRGQILERFDKGDARMDTQDTLLAEIRAETRHTNGRVTKAEGAITALEGRWKVISAKIAGAATVLYTVGQILLYALEKGWLKVPLLGN